MDRLAELKAELHRQLDVIHTLVEADGSEDHLAQIKAHLESLPEPIPYVTEAQEAKIAISMAQIARGEVMSLEEFERRGQERHLERMAKHNLSEPVSK